MLIANPMYDVVFKFLMEDLDIARGLISTIIGQEVEELHFDARESPYLAPQHSSVTLMRLDFVALIRTGDGQQRKALIELQKGRIDDDAVRFRHYLGRQYQRQDEVVDEAGEVQRRGLPIIAIYILGFNLDTRLPACIKVDRRYLDMITGEPVKGPDRFIEALSHDTYVIQAQLLHQTAQDEVESILSVFGQEEFADEQRHTKRFNEQIAKNRLLQQILRRLHQLTESPEVREQMETEDVAYAEFEAGLQSRTLEIRKSLKAAQQEVQEANAREEEAKAREKEAQNLADKTFDVAVKALMATGMSEEEAKKTLGQQ